MKNSVFHLQMKNDYTTNSHWLIHFCLKGWENVQYFLNLGVKGQITTQKETHTRKTRHSAGVNFVVTSSATCLFPVQYGSFPEHLRQIVIVYVELRKQDFILVTGHGFLKEECNRKTCHNAEKRLSWQERFCGDPYTESLFCLLWS